MKKFILALVLSALAHPSFAMSNSPFEKAVQTNNVTAAKAIVAKEDFDPNAVSEMGYYPLLFATSLNRPAITKMLLENPKTNPNILSSAKDESALRNAVMNNAVPIVQLMLANPKTNPNLEVGDSHETALQTAMEQNRLGIFKLLMADKRTDVTDRTKAGYNLLHLAAMLDKPAFMKLVLAKGKLDVNAVGAAKNAPIHFAASSSPECLKLLLAAPKINPNVLDMDGKSPVMLAIFENPASFKILKSSPKVKLSAKDKAAIKEAAKPSRGGDLG